MSKPTIAIYGIKDRNNFEYPAFVHDHNMCIMQDGRIQQYIHLERLTRRKYDNRLDLFIENLIEEKQINCDNDFDLVCVNDFVGNSFISKNGRIRFEVDRQQELKFKLKKGYSYYQYNGWDGNDIDGWLCQHEVAHICSTLPFYGEFRENSLLLSIDGGSSLGNYAAFIYKGNKFHLIENNWNDLGFASKLFNDNSLSFKILGASPGMHCSVPGKLMGFASYGKYDEKIAKWLVNNNYFKEYWNKENEILDAIKRDFGVTASYNTQDNFMQNIAATMQGIFEKAIIQKIEQLQKKYKCEYLYYGGGCALNIVTNTKIVESGMFREVFIAPCCNDSGLSIGAAALMEIKKGNKIYQHNAYLCNVGLKEQNNYLNDKDIELTAKMLTEGKIIGICNGVAEAGPRALGNRSIIAIANNKELSLKVSMDIKKREWYRPVAPIMLKKIAEQFTGQKMCELTKYMLMDYKIKTENQKIIEGVIHTNGTSRIQTIENLSDNPFMYKLLNIMNEKYGIKALINTSFNIQGEPIIHTIEDAKNSARIMNLDGVVLNGKYIETKNIQ